jgi:flavorubredoxin
MSEVAAPPVRSFDGGRLHALSNPYEIDGRVSWHPRGTRGFAPMNCYLLDAGGRALLIDTGITVHRAALLAQLDRVLPEGTPLTVLHTRLGEYNTLCNTPAVVERFAVEEVCGAHVNAELWTDFESHEGAGAEPYAHAIDGVRVRVLENDQTLAVDAAGARRLQVFVAALRLLPTHWAYDEATATLFTSDMFTHVCRPDAGGKWVVTEADDDTTLETVREHLVGTRYWWLPEAASGEIAAGLAEVFERHRVERIAPGYGCILDGPEVVERHLAMVQEVLAEGPRDAARQAPVGREVVR